MNLKKLLEKGYFPKELPPPFETKLFADKHQTINARWKKIIEEEKKKKPSESKSTARKRFQDKYGKYSSSQLAIFSISKGVYSRRKIAIPNPKQYLDLSKAVIENWSLLRNTYKLSPYSQSTPIESGANRAVRTKSNSWSNFKFQLIEKSFDKKIELRLDISQFYPTIYTHSIPWAILGKEKAKKLFKKSATDKVKWEKLLAQNNKDAKAYKSADFIDNLVRNCNDRQSIGLCIGPDTSFILAEIIGNRIDFEINKRLNLINHSGTRYYDDYYLYFDTRNDAENALKIIQQVLYEFQLETNESKVSIKNLPFQYIELWSDNLDRFKFEKSDKFEIRNFFNLLHRTIDLNKKNSSWIINYALKRFKKGEVEIKEGEWEIFLSFLLQTLIIDTSIIALIFEIILIYQVYLNNKSKYKIKNVLTNIIKEHIILNHSFEVTWSLWLFISFEIECDKQVLELVLESKDSISKILCLDLINKNLYKGRKPQLKRIKEELKTVSSFGDNWLLIYETIKQNWLDFEDDKTIMNNEYFEILKDLDISFYNNTNQIQPKVKVEIDYNEFFDIEYHLITIEPETEDDDEDDDAWY
ncbi:reverse transcriptase (RNA-dependent DNA polymerase) [Lutibacter oceani]|uniref:Reverse transcriptase (RNA-dependent DNA polymerase) n=1 Tax=Lutibacter oceani TaxID=1853311 RepID=A0A3D9RQ54_9FLAO|nr:RNA-directed DNA polymerase [Lutibacter oceani]REE78873.1 reverse transcriptase (RNA-dependent DNA polymerase) [Lutibacter oceani]